MLSAKDGIFAFDNGAVSKYHLEGTRNEDGTIVILQVTGNDIGK